MKNKTTRTKSRPAPPPSHREVLPEKNMQPRLKAASPLWTTIAAKIPGAAESEDAPRPSPSMTAWKDSTAPRINLQIMLNNFQRFPEGIDRGWGGEFWVYRAYNNVHGKSNGSTCTRRNVFPSSLDTPDLNIQGRPYKARKLKNREKPRYV